MSDKIDKNLHILLKAFALLFVFSIPWSLLGMQFTAISGALIAVFLLAKHIYVKQHTYVKHQYDFKFNQLDLAVLIYLAAVLLSWISVIGLPFDALRMSGIWTSSAYLVFRFLNLDKQEINKAMNLLLIVCFVIGVYGIVQYFLGIDFVRFMGRASVYPSPSYDGHYAVIGFFNRHHTFAISSMMSISLLATFALLKEDKHSKFGKFTFLSLLLPLVIAVILSQTRIVYLAAFAVLIFWLVSFKSKKTSLVLLLFWLIIFTIMFFTNEGVSNRVLSLFAADGFSSRWTIYNVSMSVFADNSFSGWGFGRYLLEANEAYAQLAPHIEIRSGSHNELIASIMDGGLLLGFSQLLLLVASFRIIYSKMRSNRGKKLIIFIPPLLVFILCSLGHNLIGDGEISLYYWSLTGCIASFEK